MIINDDVIKWAATYKGPKFHALFCDPPYHLISITERFGKNGSAPAKPGKDGSFERLSRGFMGETWDGGGIAFRAETWQLLMKHMHDGAFGFAYASPRTYHRLAVAIEDAGGIIHPAIGWVQAQGFPKATNVSKVLDRRNAAHHNTEMWDGHYYGGQALKPVLEMICVFQKPYDGNAIDAIIASGAGTYNVDAGRIAADPGGADDPRLGGKGSWTADTEREIYGDGWHGTSGQRLTSSPLGRWPSNLILCHTPDCHISGYKEDSYVINRFDDGAKPFGGGAGHEYQGENIIIKLSVWQCHESCPVPLMNEQTGTLKSGKMLKGTVRNTGGGYGGDMPRVIDADTIGDSGGGSRFFFQAHWFYEIQERLAGADPFRYQAKASTSEREKGLKHLQQKSSDYRPNDPDVNKLQTRLHGSRKRRNPHPTVKPIALNEYLAKLLLPPETFTPRRILVPFAGVASEMIGAYLAGWDEIIGVELKQKYAEIGETRFEYWKSLGRQLKLF